MEATDGSSVLCTCWRNSPGQTNQNETLPTRSVNQRSNHVDVIVCIERPTNSVFVLL